MKILITGNMGYLGPTITSHLRGSLPDSVLLGFDIGYFGGCATTHGSCPERFLDVQHFGDVRKFPEKLLEGVDAVVHLAAISNDPMGNTYEDVTLDINYKASIELAKKAAKNGVRAFVYASSCSIYGAADDRPRIETDPLNPLTAYARSKVYTETDLQPLADREFVATCLRFSTACGMTDRLRLDLVLNDFVAGAISEGKITILSDGSPWRPLINAKDMARAIEWAIHRQPDNGGEFLAVNVGSDEWNYQVKDLAEAVSRVSPGTQVSINKDALPDKRSYKVSFDLFKKLAPDHQPKMNLEDTVLELRKGLENIAFNDANFRNSYYMRLKVLSALREKGLLNHNLEWTPSDESL